MEEQTLQQMLETLRRLEEKMGQSGPRLTEQIYELQIRKTIDLHKEKCMQILEKRIQEKNDQLRCDLDRVATDFSIFVQRISEKVKNVNKIASSSFESLVSIQAEISAISDEFYGESGAESHDSRVAILESWVIKADKEEEQKRLNERQNSRWKISSIILIFGVTLTFGTAITSLILTIIQMLNK